VVSVEAFLLWRSIDGIEAMIASTGEWACSPDVRGRVMYVVFVRVDMDIDDSLR